jgi:hypothetical protein
MIKIEIGLQNILKEFRLSVIVFRLLSENLDLQNIFIQTIITELSCFCCCGLCILS